MYVHVHVINVHLPVCVEGNYMYMHVHYCIASIPGRRESGLVFTVCACAAITQNLGDLYIVVNWAAYLLRIRSRVIEIVI